MNTKSNKTIIYEQLILLNEPNQTQYNPQSTTNTSNGILNNKRQNKNSSKKYIFKSNQ